MNTDAVVSDLSFAQGGPLRRLEDLLRIGPTRGRASLRRRIVAYLALVYAPVLATALFQVLTTGQWPGTVTRVYPHVIALLSLPLLFVSETLADRRVRVVFSYLLESGVVAAEDEGRIRSIIESHARVRASRLPELAMLAIVGVSLAVGLSGLARLSPASWWQAIVATSVYRFLFLRWLWRWVLWGRVALQISRLPLRLAPTHADRLAGLAPLLGPSEVAFVVFMAAVAAAAAGGWADRLYIDPAAFSSMPLEAVALGIAAVLVAVAPLSFFTPLLTRARKDGLRHYGALEHQHDRAFRDRWIEHSGDPLGHPDMSSLADLGTGFQRVDAMWPVMWTPRLVKVVLAGTWLPFVPLVLIKFGFADLLLRVVKVVV
jgi:hypothetical protein